MQSTNFEFLRGAHPELASLGGFAEHYAVSDPASAAIKLRAYAEAMVSSIFADQQLLRPYKANLNDLLTDDCFKAATPAVVIDKLHALRIQGNRAAHGAAKELKPHHSMWLLKEAHALGQWFFISYAGGTKDRCRDFIDIEAQAEHAKAERERDKKVVLQQLAAQEAQMASLLADLESARSRAAAAEKSQEDLQAILNRTQQTANALNFNETSTRRRLIDELLIAAGWDVGANGKNTDQVGQEVEVLHQPTQTGGGLADYVLWDDDGKPLAVVEAKKTAVDAQKGKVQARCYAHGLEKMYGQRPVIFYTNGFDLWIWDDAKNEPPRRIYGFYAKESIKYCLFQTRNRADTLATRTPSPKIVDRIYQIEAIQRVSETFDARQRKALLVQATGTGKTRVAVAMADLLIRANWVKRVLFLCDRLELRKQAHNVFKEYLEQVPRVYVGRTTAQDRTKRVYLATYPAMMKCFETFDVGFFDLIIADESHRSIYNRYRDLFLYFDAYQVGLTATPLKFIFRNTYKLFRCEDADPTAYYPYDRAVQEGHLAPFKVMKHTTKFLREGIKYKDMTVEQREQLEDQVDDPEAVDYQREQVDQKVFNKDTDRHILRNLMENGIRSADGTTLGKTIIFARNHKHAMLLNELFDEMYPQYGGTFCQVIDNYEPRASQLIDDFKTNDGSKDLAIVISVDMLDTGIDVPEVVNLVFAKPVKSYAKFWQMIGRGTRLCPDLFGPDRHKKYFQIFDHWGNFEFFDEVRTEEEPGQPKSLMQTLFETRLSLAEAALDKQDAVAFDIAANLLHGDAAALPEKTIAIREKWRDVRSVLQPGVIKGFAAATKGMLRNEIAPLMQWRNLDRKEAAYRFDLLIARMQDAMLRGAGSFDDLKDDLLNQVTQLPINLAQVREKLGVITRVKAAEFWLKVNVPALEDVRKELRGVMRFRARTLYPTDAPLLLDIREEHGEYHVHPVKLEGLDLVAYRHRVEAVLEAVFDHSSALQKIKAGEPVSENEMRELISAVLFEDPDLNVEELLVHYPNKAHRLDLAIRQIIGMDAAKVDAVFTTFIQKYPRLNAHQIRFLELLKGYIAQYGAIEPEKLWDSPFTTIDSNGVDGVFTEEPQAEDLLAIVDQFAAG